MHSVRHQPFNLTPSVDCTYFLVSVLGDRPLGNSVGHFLQFAVVARDSFLKFAVLAINHPSVAAWRTRTTLVLLTSAVICLVPGNNPYCPLLVIGVCGVHDIRGHLVRDTADGLVCAC